jgi:23S rRNA pseudouridine2605 synthase
MTLSSSQMPERVAKAIARAGVCSRRDAEKLISERKVKINQHVIDSPATLVTERDSIEVNGCPLPQKVKPRLWCYYKPRGVVTTHKDPQGRPTLFSTLPPTLPRVISVGRLDLMSEGLILLTNDGALARQLELPSTRLKRVYRIRVFGRVEQERLAQLKKGITIDGVHYGPIDARIVEQQNSNCWLRVSLREGKNRELRKIFSHLGYTINRLIRENYGPFTIDRLQHGTLYEVPPEVLQEFLHALEK